MLYFGDKSPVLLAARPGDTRRLRGMDDYP